MSEIDNYANLLVKYEKVCDELSSIKKEYEENTIIQSMNDMKTIYEKQKVRIETMDDLIDRIHDKNRAIKIMLSSLSKQINGLRRVETINRYDLKIKFEFIEDIMDETLKIKTELYYFDY